MIVRTLVLDTSVWINILATGEFERIISAVARRCLVPEHVLTEVRRDPVTKQDYSASHHPLLRGPPVEVVALDDTELGVFLDLVSAPARDRLGDGEAAAIATAIFRRAVLAIDERKARRILRERFPTLSLLRSVDLLRSPEVVAALGKQAAQDCFERARHFGRMDVGKGE